MPNFKISPSNTNPLYISTTSMTYNGRDDNVRTYRELTETQTNSTLQIMHTFNSGMVCSNNNALNNAVISFSTDKKQPSQIGALPFNYVSSLYKGVHTYVGNHTANNNVGLVYILGLDTNITNPDGQTPGDKFGFCVKVINNQVIVGAPSSNKRVHVFQYPSMGVRDQYLTEGDIQTDGMFGYTIVGDGTKMFISEPHYTVNNIKIGRIHFYEYTTQWNRTSTIENQFNGIEFGKTMCYANGKLIVSCGHKIAIYNDSGILKSTIQSCMVNPTILKLDTDGTNLAVLWEHDVVNEYTNVTEKKTSTIIYKYNTWNRVTSIDDHLFNNVSIFGDDLVVSLSNKPCLIHYKLNNITQLDISRYDGLGTSTMNALLSGPEYWLSLKNASNCDLAFLIPPSSNTYKNISCYFKDRKISYPHTNEELELETRYKHPSHPLVFDQTETNGSTELSEMGFISKLQLTKYVSNTDSYVKINSQINSQNNVYHLIGVEKNISEINLATYVGTSTDNLTYIQKPHHLGQVPSAILIKNTSINNNDNWMIWHKDMAVGTICDFSDVAPFKEYNNTTYLRPTSTHFNVYGNKRENYFGDDYVATLLCNGDNVYCGTYAGTNAANTIQLQLAKKPTLIMIKNITSNSHWVFYYTDPKDDSSVCKAMVNVGYVPTNEAQISDYSITLNANLTHCNRRGDNYIFIAFSGMDI